MAAPPMPETENEHQDHPESWVMVEVDCSCKSLSPNRPPNLNLANYSCVETGGSLNPPGVEPVDLGLTNPITMSATGKLTESFSTVTIGRCNVGAMTNIFANNNKEINYPTSTPALTQASYAASTTSTSSSSSPSPPASLLVSQSYLERSITLSEFLAVTPDPGLGEIEARRRASYDFDNEYMPYPLRRYLFFDDPLERRYPCVRVEDMADFEYVEEAIDVDEADYNDEEPDDYDHHHGAILYGDVTFAEKMIAGPVYLNLDTFMGKSASTSMQGNGKSSGPSSKDSEGLTMSFGGWVRGNGGWMEGNGEVVKGPLEVDVDEEGNNVEHQGEQQGEQRDEDAMEQ